MSDPYSDDHNPFANVDEYNPFPKTSSAPRVVVNESIPSYSSSSPTPSTRDVPSYDSETIRLDDNSDSDDMDAFYGGQQEDINPYKPDSYNISSSPYSSSMSTSRGVVSVQTTAVDPNELSVWEMDFYRQFFNVDSSEVAWRCLRSMWPFKVDFIAFVSTNPDFYGPFWITTTLIFMLAASANFADFLAFPATWKYDFLKLTVGTGIIYGFTFGLPLLFWLYFKWADLNISLIELLCIYGYSMFVYIPASIVCMAPFNPVQWAVLSIGCIISTAFLVVNMWAPLRGKLAHAIPLVIIMALLHAAIGLTFMLYYFQFNHSAPTPVTPVPVPITPTPTPAPFPPTTTGR